MTTLNRTNKARRARTPGLFSLRDLPIFQRVEMSRPLMPFRVPQKNAG